MSIQASTQIPQKYEELFCKATEIIAPHVNSKRISVFFVRDILIVNLVVEERISEYWRDVIIYNLSKIEKFQDERQIMVIFLEELVHAYYDTLDEYFVGNKVAELYPDVTFNEKTHQYEFK